MKIKITIASLIYNSKVYADSIYDTLFKNTPELHTGEAEFFFIANDASEEVINHLIKQKYKFYINDNPSKSETELLEMGYAYPEYIHRVYKGWNKVFEYAEGDIVVLLNSDMIVSKKWLDNILKNLTADRIVTSRLVESPSSVHHARWAGAIPYNLGDNPINFDEDKFKLLSKLYSLPEFIPGGAFMPCAVYKDVAISAGLYPEGNLSAGSWMDILRYGDEDFFYNRLSKKGVNHITAMDSIVYHFGEGESREVYKKTDFINKFINFRKYKSYLELGTNEKETFNKIKCNFKTSVDLNFDSDYKMSTDEFFKINTDKFDIIFIDANHTEAFLTRDIYNSLNCLNDGGVIICHDVNPPNEYSQIDENFLYQTAWKSFVKFRLSSNFLTYSLPYDCGLGIIDKKYQAEKACFELPVDLEFSDLDRNRELFLGFKHNIIL